MDSQEKESQENGSQEKGSPEKKSQVWQYNLISALMDGVADGGITVKQAMEHGDFGIGTFHHLDGELIVIENHAYKMDSDGTVMKIFPQKSDHMTCPFVQMTKLDLDIASSKPLHFASKEAILAAIDKLLPRAKNHFVAVRFIECTFKSISCRTVGGQKEPGEGLVEVGKHQTSRTFRDVKGTIVGFRCPAFMQGISVAGLHMHFITEDRIHGGHVLEANFTGRIGLQQMSTFHLEMPADNEEFDKAKLVMDDQGIKGVEG